MSTQCPHGQLARQCLLCEQAAEIERLNGSMCVVLLADPETYKDMARRALAAKEDT